METKTEREPFTRGSSSPFVDNAGRSLLLLNVFRTPKVLAHKNLDEPPHHSTALHTHTTLHHTPHSRLIYELFLRPRGPGQDNVPRPSNYLSAQAEELANCPSICTLLTAYPDWPRPHVPLLNAVPVAAAATKCQQH